MALGLVARTGWYQDRRMEDLVLHCGHTGGRFELGPRMDVAAPAISPAPLV